jgi:Ni,Fe-hydrogenase III large subunit
MASLRQFAPGTAIPLQSVPDMQTSELWDAIRASVAGGGRLAAMFGVHEAPGVRLYALLAEPAAQLLAVGSTLVEREYPALTPSCPQAHWFERDIAEEFGTTPAGHPWLKPIRFNQPGARVGVTDYFSVDGDEVHEVAVGPVHAGIIEPGHFRMQAHGERVLHLEISLGYQHRGVERALTAGPDKRSVHYAETLAGDTTIGHTTAYSELIEALSGVQVPERAQFMRSMALELERLANHVGDLGALANDVGYLPTAAFCGRIRGDFLNLTAQVCGSRFGRGWIRPGGSAFDLDAAQLEAVLDGVNRAEADARVAVDLLWDTPSVRARFEHTGTLSAEACRDLGIVGVAARASGLERDVRTEFPRGGYAADRPAMVTEPGGDVLARAQVRWAEIEQSVGYVRRLAARLGPGPVRSETGALAPRHLAATLVEGWRGEICHVVITGDDGRFARYKVVDPSLHNWAGLAFAMRGQQISDFPLCNKSFNLSYCGHDL